MKQILLQNARFGLDTRRDVLTSQLGTFVALENCHISQGAEIEGRKAFVKLGTLPQSAFGLESLPTTLVTFGSRAIVLMTADRQRTTNVATLTFPARVPTQTTHDFLVNDVVTVSGLGGAGYNGTVTITGITTTTISFASVGGNEVLTADTDGSVTVVLLAGLQYQRLRHYRFAMGQLNTEVVANSNPNTYQEPAMTSLVYSCSFNGSALAIASFGAQPNNVALVFDPFVPWTGVFFQGAPVDSSYQGLLDIYSSFYVAGGAGATNSWLVYPLLYTANRTLTNIGITASYGSGWLGMNFTGPANQPFSMSVDDDVGNIITTSQSVAASTNIVAVAGKVTIYFTKGSAGNISVLTAPLVTNGVVAGTTDLLSGLGNVVYDRSLYQTAIDIAARINAGTSGYTAQANSMTSVVAALTIIAPTAYGNIVNTENLTITSTTIFVSSIFIAGSGAVAAATTFAFAGGINAAPGVGQVQKLVFGAPQLGFGSYSATLTFNGIDYTLGAGNLTSTRASTAFFITSGGAGTIGPILLADGTNILGVTVVAFDTDLEHTCRDIVQNINQTSGTWPIPVATKPTSPSSWQASVVESANGIFGVAIHAPIGMDQYNGANNITVASATMKVAANATDTGTTFLTLSLTGGVPNPSFLFTMGQKAYAVLGKKVPFSKINDGSRWETNDTGAGFLNSFDQSSAPSAVLGIGAYQGKLAVLARRNTQIWNIDANPNNYALFQNLPNIGTIDGKSIQSIGELDLLFLADSGVRSLRAQVASLAAYVSDIGAPIDQLIVESLIAGPNTNICSVVEPTTNRYWLYLNGVIYVRSSFPEVKINAWSTYTPTRITFLGNPTSADYTYTGLTIGWKYYFSPSADAASWTPFYQAGPDGSFIATSTTLNVKVGFGGVYNTTTLYEATQFVPQKMVVYSGQVYILDTNNNVYVYGGANNTTYDGSVVTAETPWIDGKSPYTPKQFLGFDAAIAGQWYVQGGADPKSGLLELILSDGDPATPSVTQDSSFDKGAIPMTFQGTHLKLKFQSSVLNTDKVLIGSFAALYNDMEPT